MGEIKKFTQQPVLSQILDVIPSKIIHAANRKHKSNENSAFTERHRFSGNKQLRPESVIAPGYAAKNETR